MNLRKRAKHTAVVETGALNDILFILLLFFLIVSTLANPNVIQVNRPKAKSDTKAKQTVVVSIDATEQYYVGSNKVPFDQLKTALQNILAQHPGEASPTVVINSDKTVPFGDVVQVMVLARSLNAKAVVSVDSHGATQ